MSGGTFDYNQYKIREIAEHIESVINKNGKKIPERDKNSWDNECYYNYPKEIINKFKKAVKILKEAEVYTQRIDYLLAGDDGQESFLKRLEKELNSLKTNKRNE
jgi:hypothetical protein